MTNLNITLEGHKALLAALEDMSEEIELAVSEVVQETAAGIEAGVKLRMQQSPATGRTYKRRGVAHRASARGEAPAPDTGALMGSVYHEMTGKLSAVAGSRLAYSAFLEFRTFKMAPRPAWVPETEQARNEFTRDIAAAIARATQ